MTASRQLRLVLASRKRTLAYRAGALSRSTVRAMHPYAKPTMQIIAGT